MSCTKVEAKPAVACGPALPRSPTRAPAQSPAPRPSAVTRQPRAQPRLLGQVASPGPAVVRPYQVPVCRRTTCIGELPDGTIAIVSRPASRTTPREPEKPPQAARPKPMLYASTEAAANELLRAIGDVRSVIRRYPYPQGSDAHAFLDDAEAELVGIAMVAEAALVDVANNRPYSRLRKSALLEAAVAISAAMDVVGRSTRGALARAAFRARGVLLRLADTHTPLIVD